MSQTLAPSPQAASAAGAEPVCVHCPARMSDLCAGVPDSELLVLETISSHVQLAPGETLILDGDPADHVYNVISGELMMTRLGSDGRRQILAFLPAGTFIGFASEDHYRFNVEALTACELCRFDRDKLEPLFAAHPEMERRFREMAARVIDAKLDLIFALGRRNATERIAAFLLHLRDLQRQGDDDIQGRSWRIPISRADMADYLGLTIETVSRVLSRLKANGIVRVPTLHSFEILDEQGLERAAGER